jgi:DnaK suppressor protein
VKKAAPKPVARKAPAKAPPKKAAPAKKAAAKKAPAKKVVARKTPAKTPAKKAGARKVVAKKPAPAKAVVKKAAPKTASKAGATKKPAIAKPAPRAAGKKTAKPAAPARHVPVKPVVRPEPVAAPAKSSPSSTSRLFKGKVASATAMVAPQATASAGHSASSHKKSKNSSSPMNKLATKQLDNGVTREDGRYALPSTSTIALPKDYRPSNNEEYMNPRHLAYFRNKLRDWRDQLVEESRQTMDNLREEVRDVGDEAERATRETENSLELRTRDRYRKLISKIDKALRRIEEGSYGFCEETDEEIGIDRLDARPIATLSLDAQERREHLQKQMGD